MTASYHRPIWALLISLGPWIGGIIASLFPWPFVILVLFLLSPVRSALNIIVTSLSESIRALRHLKAVGIELTLDPLAAQEVAAKSSAIVSGDFEIIADKEVRKKKIWGSFKVVIDDVIRPLATVGFRSTIHIEDVLRDEALYQLIEYYHVMEPQGPTKTRGRRNSIRFGIIGRAWRSGTSEYDPKVTTDVPELIKIWGMTHEEAVRAGRGRQSFAVILLRDSSGNASGLIFVDAQAAQLLGEISISELESKVNAAAKKNGLSDRLTELRQTLMENYRAPIIR